MAVRIRMKKMGRAHRSFFRICAFDHHAPRDGRPIEELGTYDPSLPETDARAVFNAERMNYWLSVGAQPSEKCAVLIKKYGSQGTHVEQQKKALDLLASPKSIPDPGAPASLPKKKEEPKAEETKPEEAKTEAPAAEEAPAATEAVAEAPAAKAEEAPAEKKAKKKPAKKKAAKSKE